MGTGLGMRIGGGEGGASYSCTSCIRMCCTGCGTGAICTCWTMRTGCWTILTCCTGTCTCCTMRCICTGCCTIVGEVTTRCICTGCCTIVGEVTTVGDMTVCIGAMRGETAVIAIVCIGILDTTLDGEVMCIEPIVGDSVLMGCIIGLRTLIGAAATQSSGYYSFGSRIEERGTRSKLARMVSTGMEYE
jgi:hypothetical protein